MLDKPLIICEGKTDIIYLKCALKQLEIENLVNKENAQVELLINFLNQSKTFNELFCLSEGTSGLLRIMDIYHLFFKHFKIPGKKYPVIIIADNDQGSKGIRNKLGEGVVLSNFNYYKENLYVVFISSGNENAEEIEDLFDEDILSSMIEGKSFNWKSKINPETEYGKKVFAEKIIKQNQNTINFENFRNLLTCILNAIEDYKLKN